MASPSNEVSQNRFTELVNNHKAPPRKKTVSTWQKFIAHCCDSYNKRTARFYRNPAVITPRETKALSAFRDFCIDNGCNEYEEINQAYDKVMSAILLEKWVARQRPLKISDLLANDKLIGRFNLHWFDTILGEDGEPTVKVAAVTETNNIDRVYQGKWLVQIVDNSHPATVRLVNGTTLRAYPNELAPVTDHSFYAQAKNDPDFRRTKAYLSYLNEQA